MDGYAGGSLVLGSALLLALVALAPGAAAAQVGHPPGRSPYRDIPKGHTVTGFGALFGGTGGRFGIAPHDGTLFGLRYDIRTGSTIQFGLSLARGTMERLIVDPFVVLENRVRGPVDQTVSFAEINLQFNLTGGKTWHRLAPFVGVGAGLTFPSGTAADTSGFELGRKIYFAPHAGIPVLPHRPIAPAHRRPSPLLEAQLSRQLHPGAAGRARGTAGHHRRERERVDHVLLAPGRTGLLLLPLARCPSP